MFLFHNIRWVVNNNAMLEAILGFSKELKFRNKELFYFGALCLALSIVCIVLSKLTITD